MKRSTIFWLLLPLGLIILAGSLILALPDLVSSPQNRSTIESLASSLTGSQVHIAGNLSLALRPAPQLIANDVTITGPDAETITAKSLTIDIALSPLLHGKLSASSLMLQTPNIVFPWPLPRGVISIAPPPWLTTLHAQINNGRISIGALNFTNVSADIFTGAEGALSVAGNGALLGQHVDVTLSLGALDTTATAPLTIDVKQGKSALHLSGTASTANSFTGTFAVTSGDIHWLTNDATQALSATGAIKADPGNILVSDVKVLQGHAQLHGDMSIDFTKPALDLHMNGDNLAIQPDASKLHFPALGGLSVHGVVSLDHSSVNQIDFSHLLVDATLSNAGVNIANASATMAGDSNISLVGTLDPSGQLQANWQLSSADILGITAALGRKINLAEPWPAQLTGTIDGTSNKLAVAHINGVLGNAHVTGTAAIHRTLDRNSVNGQLHFSQIDLTPVAATLDHFTPTANLSANFEITADHASYEKIAMSHLLIDAGLDQQLTVRQLTASLYNGIIAASFTVAPGGQISSARALLSVPSAEPLAALLPSNLQPPVAVANAPLAATIIASGPANALATSFTLSLGDFNLTASPIVDLVNLKANGALTLHHPSAIAAFKNFGLAGSLAWPGAGSISLRANMLLSPTQSGLPDFVLSMGDLTAAGRILITPDNKVTGQITADTLALPPLANNLTPVWNVIGVTNGAIEMSANRVLFNGQKILGASTASIALHQNDATLTIQHAVLGNGNVTGTISATTAPATPPSLATALTLQAIDLSSIQLPLVFPITLPSGVADAQVNLTASGFAPTAWLATLNGTATMQAKSGTVAGFNLAGLSAALPLAGKTALRAACLAGTSSYDQLGMTATIDHGILKITSANLQGPAGSGSVSGTIDLPDQDLALNFSLLPKVRTPPVVGLSVVGPWAKPHRIPDLRAASRWQATN